VKTSYGGRSGGKEGEEKKSGGYSSVKPKVGLDELRKV